MASLKRLKSATIAIASEFNSVFMLSGIFFIVNANKTIAMRAVFLEGERDYNSSGVVTPRLYCFWAGDFPMLKQLPCRVLNVFP